MNYLEEITMIHLTKVKKCFVFPQFDILYNNTPWSCPDFVALDFINKKIAVVEVTSGYNIKNLLDKLANVNLQYFDKLLPQLKAIGIPIDDFEGKEVWVYVRERNSNFFSGKENIICQSFESIGYDWEDKFWKGCGKLV
jgi:hypothetical protein